MALDWEIAPPTAAIAIPKPAAREIIFLTSLGKPPASGSAARANLTPPKITKAPITTRIKRFTFLTSFLFSDLF
jgi:hypothetical protein